MVSQQLHATVNRTFTTLWGHPNNILGWVFNITGFAMNAVLGVDLQFIFAGIVFDKFVNTGRAIALFGACINLQVGVNRNIGEMKTELKRSNVIFPSGLGYSIFAHSAAGCRHS